MGDHHTESAARQRRSARNDWSLQPETISEKSAMREKRPATSAISDSRFRRSAASGAITITLSKNASTVGRKVAMRSSASA